MASTATGEPQWLNVMQRIGENALEVAHRYDIGPTAGVAFILLIIALKWYLHHLRQKRAVLPPGPSFSWPVVGETLQFFRNPSRFMFERMQRYGGTFRTNILGFTVYVPGDIESIRQVQRAAGSIDFFVPGKSFTLLLPNIKHMQEPEQHALFRKFQSASLGPGALSNFLPALQNIAEQHIERWAQEGRVSVTWAGKELGMDFAIDVITGVPHDGVDKSWAKERYLSFNNGLYALPLDLPGSGIRRARQAKAELMAALLPAITQELNRFKQEVGEDDEVETSDSLGMMRAQLLAARPYYPLDPALAFDRALGNVVAASDTTRYALLIALAAVGVMPRVQDKLRQEQREVVSSHGSELSARSMAAMPYLDAAVKEALRLMPAANGGFRKAKEDIQVGAYTIPKGGIIMWSTHMPHHLDPAVKPQGGFDVGASGLPAHMDYIGRFESAYQPERWLSDESRPKAFMTFGYGAHMCLGMNLVLTEIKLTLALLLRRYTIRMLDPAVLSKARWFPGPSPLPGTDDMELTPLDQPIA